MTVRGAAWSYRPKISALEIHARALKVWRETAAFSCSRGARDRCGELRVRAARQCKRGYRHMRREELIGGGVRRQFGGEVRVGARFGSDG